MKQAEAKNPQELDEAWDDATSTSPSTSSPPPWSSSRPPPPGQIELSSVDYGWDTDASSADVPPDLDEGWDVGEDARPVDDRGPATVPRRSAARRKPAARKPQPETTPTTIIAPDHWGLSKKDRRELERKQRAQAAQRSAQRKQEEKREREQRRRSEQQARAEQRAAEQRAAAERAAERRSLGRRAAEQFAAEKRARRKKTPLLEERRDEREPSSRHGVSAAPSGAQRKAGAQRKKSARKAAKRLARARARRIAFGVAAALLLLALVVFLANR